MGASLPHLLILISIMVGTGTLSGIAAALWAPEKSFRENWIRYTLIGIVSALTVPLFLSTIQSDLIKSPASSTFEPEKYLIFAGLCALAAFYAPNYLKRLSDRILQQLEETKKQANEAKKTALQTQQEVRPLIEREYEPSDDEVE